MLNRVGAVVAVLLAGWLPGMVEAATVRFDLAPIVVQTERSDPRAPDFTGLVGGGSFSFDNSAIRGVGNEVIGAGALRIDVSLFGQRFNQANDRRAGTFPALLLIDGAPAALDFAVSRFGGNPVRFDDRRVLGFFTDPFTTLTLVAPATYAVAVTATSIAPVPLPAGLPLLLGAAGVFGLLGWRRRRTA